MTSANKRKSKAKSKYRPESGQNSSASKSRHASKSSSASRGSHASKRSSASRGSHASKRSNKNGGRIAAILTVLAIISVSVIIGLLIRKKGNNLQGDTVSVTDYGTDHGGNREYIEIKAEDCSLYVGTVLDLKCLSGYGTVPENITWTTSDADIVSVDDNGHIEVKGTGTAIITATTGNLTDSVIIIGIEYKEESESGEHQTEPALPIYIPDGTGNIIPVKPVATEPYSGENSTTASGTVPEGPDEPETKFTLPVTEPVIPERPDETATAAPVIMPTEAPEPETEPQPEADYMELINASITGLGYTRYGDTSDFVYIYVEDGNYLGEVIVNDEFVHIYVRTRTTGFDRSLIELIKLVFPQDFEKVYTAFVSAGDNRTMTVKGHKVRIRPANGDNHAQLIISY